MANRRVAGARRPSKIAKEPDCVVPDDYAPARTCAVCDMGPGRSPSGEELGDLEEHPLDASSPPEARRSVHRGCAGAARVARSGIEPLTVSRAAASGEVHLLLQEYARDARGNGYRRRAVCGAETTLGDAEIEWSIFVAGHPSCCARCGAHARGGERAVRLPRPR